VSVIFRLGRLGAVHLYIFDKFVHSFED